MTWFINFLWLHLPNHLVAFELAFPFVTLTTIAKKSFPKDVFPSTLMQIKQNKCFIESKFHMSQFGSRRTHSIGITKCCLSTVYSFQNIIQGKNCRFTFRPCYQYYDSVMR